MAHEICIVSPVTHWVVVVSDSQRSLVDKYILIITRMTPYDKLRSNYGLSKDKENVHILCT